MIFPTPVNAGDVDDSIGANNNAGIEDENNEISTLVIFHSRNFNDVLKFL